MELEEAELLIEKTVNFYTCFYCNKKICNTALRCKRCNTKQWDDETLPRHTTPFGKDVEIMNRVKGDEVEQLEIITVKEK